MKMHHLGMGDGRPQKEAPIGGWGQQTTGNIQTNCRPIIPLADCPLQGREQAHLCNDCQFFLLVNSARLTKAFCHLSGEPIAKFARQNHAANE